MSLGCEPDDDRANRGCGHEISPLAEGWRRSPQSWGKKELYHTETGNKMHDVDMKVLSEAAYGMRRCPLEQY